MKTKTINNIIKHKFDQWLESIKDEKVRNLVQNNSIVTGGAIASMLLNEDVNDFDFYFRNKETTKAVAEYYVAQFKKNSNDDDELPRPSSDVGIDVGITVREEGDRIKIVAKSAGVAAEGDGETPYEPYRYFELDPSPNSDAGSEYIKSLVDISNKLKENSKGGLFKPVFLSSNAITLSGNIQVVIRFYGDPATIHENYDFVHCKNYWTSWENKVTLNADALECLLTKELLYVGSKYPVASVCRIRKFLERGWHITAGQILKILMQISELNLKDFSVMEEQLTGVDIAYFHQIIDKMKEKDPKAVDFAYMATLIDELF